MSRILGGEFVRGAFIPDGAAAVTKSDTTILPVGTVSLYVGGTGDVYVDTWGDDVDVKWTAVPTGATIVGSFKRVKAATTATAIVCQYVKVRTS